MKILHCCLACFYIENYAYQENILPRMHQRMGHEVKILASTETYIDNSVLGYIEPCTYINNDNIEVTRIPYNKCIPKSIAPKIRMYRGVYDYISSYSPDLIFLHDVQFYDILNIVKYKKRHPSTVIVADGHSDYNNSAKSFLSRNILHKLYYKPLVRYAEQYISCFYGTLPSRNIFFNEMYGIPPYKLEYLPMGIDDDKLKLIESSFNRDAFRADLGIHNDDIVLITGGKINRKKIGIINLVKAITEYHLNVKLIVFGSFDEEMWKEYEMVVDSNKVLYVGWLNEIDSIKYMLASDLAVFPCLHSTLWEQAAGTGLPCILYKMEHFTHINTNNNCVFIDNIDSRSIAIAISNSISKLPQLKNNAEVAKEQFSYSYVAEKVLDEMKTF